jgi:hypothetical protein
MAAGSRSRRDCRAARMWSWSAKASCSMEHRWWHRPFIFRTRHTDSRNSSAAPPGHEPPVTGPAAHHAISRRLPVPPRVLGRPPDRHADFTLREGDLVSRDPYHGRRFIAFRWLSSCLFCRHSLAHNHPHRRRTSPGNQATFTGGLIANQRSAVSCPDFFLVVCPKSPANGGGDSHRLYCGAEILAIMHSPLRHWCGKAAKGSIYTVERGRNLARSMTSSSFTLANSQSQKLVFCLITALSLSKYRSNPLAAVGLIG